MGAWGTGLYSGDFASDLKSVIAAVARLPLAPDEIVGAVRGVEPTAASNPADEDHSIFWLVLADQFEKRGIFSQQVRETALDIIDAGKDPEAMRALGMRPGDLRKRVANLMELRGRIVAQPATTKPRKTMSLPEPYVFEVGGVYAYPTKQGRPINPYMTPKWFDRAAWAPDGVGLFLALGRGRAFEYLAWYAGATSIATVPAPPDREALAAEIRWRAEPILGTCPPNRFRKLEMTEVAVFAIDPDRRAHFFPHLASGLTYAISDICISNKLDIGRREARAWSRGVLGKMAPIVYPAPPTLAELAPSA
jgi:hypothetical protein